MDNDAIVKEITEECKKAIKSIDIVTPEVYETIFFDIAKKSGYEIEEFEKFSKDLINSQISTLVELNEKSSNHVIHLDVVSKKALDAMHIRDETKLKESISETEALRLEIEKLKESIFKDSLTKAWTRRWLDTNLLDENGRFKNSCIIVIVDLNYFKQINDKLGHIAGDKVLQYIFFHLQSIGVPVVRYGGDEFLLIFDESFIFERVKEIMENSRELLLKKKLKYNRYTFGMCFSYGVYFCKEKESFTRALEKADKQMYEDKKEIKKRVKPYFHKHN
jgi:diguanylate cyclase (GGDEF)-like protein